MSGSTPSSLERLGGLPGAQCAAAREGDHRRRGDMGRVDLEQRPQVLAGVAPPEAVRPERQIVRRQPARDHVRQRLHPVRRGHDRSALVRQDLADVGDPRPGVRVEPIPALGLERVPPQERERRGAVDLRRHAELFGQDVAGGQDLLEDRPGSDQPSGMRIGTDRGSLREPVDPAQEPVVDPARSWRLGVVLVVDRDVVEDVLALDVHPLDPVADDGGQLVARRPGRTRGRWGSSRPGSGSGRRRAAGPRRSAWSDPAVAPIRKPRPRASPSAHIWSPVRWNPNIE